MRMLLFMAVTAMAFTPVYVNGGKWTKTIHVYDYSPAEWDGVFQQTVADAGAILPGRAPRLLYHRMNVLNCATAPIKKRAIVICQGSPERWPPDFRDKQAMAYFPIARGVFKWSRVELNERKPVTPAGRAGLACHELIGHAILGITDDYNSKTPEESCIHAWADKPGTWDIDVAQSLYKKQKRHKH